jgi:hypothetical protein
LIEKDYYAQTFLMEKNLGKVKEIHLRLFNLPNQFEPHKPKIEPGIVLVPQPSPSSFETEPKLIEGNIPNQIEFEKDMIWKNIWCTKTGQRSFQILYLYGYTGPSVQLNSFKYGNNFRISSFTG